MTFITRLLQTENELSPGQASATLSSRITCMEEMSERRGWQEQLRGNYDFTHLDETVNAARMAYEGAGIKNPQIRVTHNLGGQAGSFTFFYLWYFHLGDVEIK